MRGRSRIFPSSPHPLLNRFFSKIHPQKSISFLWLNLRKGTINILSNYHTLVHLLDCLLYSLRKNNTACFLLVFSESNFVSLEQASKYLFEHKELYSSIQCERIVQLTTHAHCWIVKNK